MGTQPYWNLSPEQLSHLDSLFVHLSTPPAGRAFVRSAIADGPARTPQNQRGGNCAVEFYSGRLSAHLLLESRTGEYAKATELEDDPDVVFFLPQAPRQALAHFDDTGRRTTVTSYTGDFLAIRKGRIEVIEVRHEDALMKKHESSPYQLYFDAAEGRWRYRAAEAHFSAMGIDFRIWATRQINTTRVNNARFLEDYVQEDCPHPDPVLIDQLKAVLDTNLAVPYFELLKQGFDADLLLMAVARRDVYVDFDTDRLDVPQSLSLYASKAVRELYRTVEISKLDPVQPLAGAMAVRAGTRITHGSRALQVILCTERDILMRDERGQQETWSLETFQNMHAQGLLQTDVSGAIGPQYSDMSKETIMRAQARLNALRNQDLSAFSQASLDKFAARTRTARNELEALMALVDEVESRGNRQPRTDARCEEVIERAIKEKYNTKECPTKLSAYKYYAELCERLEIEEPEKPRPYCVSKTTFFSRLTEKENVRARKGKRVAYQQGAIVVPGSNDLPVHGVVAHGVCYVDHTQPNLATVSGNDPGLALDKPWMSVAIDGCTTQARALLLMYDPPSAATVLLLLRDYVRRNGRLPKVLSLDNAKDLKNQSLREFCRLFGIDLRYRPPGQPRGAAPIEAAIGASEIECISNLEGNTRSLKDARMTTKSVNGFNFAVHTLVSAYNILEEYYFVTREHRVCAALGMTPAEYEQQRKHEAGAREHVVVRYDETLMLLTSPYAKRPMHIVCPRRGVWVDGMWYAHSDLRGLSKGTKVEVRVEPFAARVIYVCVKGRWKAAVGINSRQLDGRTRREVAIVAREHQKRSGTAAKKDRESRNGWMSTDYSPELYDPRIAEKQREQKYLFNMMKLLGALTPEQIETGDDQPFDLMRDPTPYGMHVGKAASPEQPLWLPEAAEGSQAEQPQTPAPVQSQPATDVPRSAHQQQEDQLFEAALEEFL